MNTEILINSSLVTHDGYRESYEFVLDETLQVIECVKVDPMAQNIISPIEDASVELDGLLFELNHVRKYSKNKYKRRSSCRFFG